MNIILFGLIAFLVGIAGILFFRLKQEQRQTQQAIEQTESLTKRLKELEKKQKKATEEQERLKERLKTRIEQLEKEKTDRIKALERDLMGLQKQTQAGDSVIQDLQHRLEDAIKDKNEALSKVSELQKQVETERKHADDYKKQVAGYKKQLKETNEELLKYQDKVDRLVTMEIGNRRLKAEVDKQQRRLAELSKIANDNRIAWIVTQKQLEMAEDKIHMLLKGFPRPGSRTHDPDVILADMLSKQHLQKTSEGHRESKES